MFIGSQIMNKEDATTEMNRRDDLLDEYEKGLGLVSVQPADISEYLNYTRDQLEKLTPAQCAETSYLLIQYAFFLQRSYNKEMARLNWAKATSKEILAESMGNYKAYSYEERFYQAAKENAYASKLISIQKYCQQRVDRLNFLSASIKSLADCLKSIQINKVGKHE